MTQKENTLLIDSREPTKLKKTIQKYFTQQEIPTKITQLPQGDYQYNKIVIERKEIRDYSSSLKTGRLRKQIYKLQKQRITEQTHPYIFIQGTYKTLIQQSHHIPQIQPLTQKQYAGSRAKITEQGIHITRLETRKNTELCNEIHSLIRHYNPTKIEIEPPLIKEPHIPFGINILYQITGISRQKAEQIHDKLTIKDIINQPTEELEKTLTQIPGIGKKTAQKIITTVKTA